MQTDGGTDGRRGGGCGAGSAVGQRQRSSGRSLMRVNQLSCVAAGLNISDAEAKGAATLGVILQVALYCKSIHTRTHTCTAPPTWRVADANRHVDEREKSVLPVEAPSSVHSWNLEMTQPCSRRLQQKPAQSSDAAGRM